MRRPRPTCERAAGAMDADIVLMAAAVSDYRPSQTDTAKRPKDDNRWTIDLEADRRRPQGAR